MKTIITSSGDNINATYDLRFARSPWFCVYDEKSKTVTFHLNEHHESKDCVGIKAAEKIIELGGSRVISGDFGSKAFEFLNKHQIQMITIHNSDETVKGIISRIK